MKRKRKEIPKTIYPHFHEYDVKELDFKRDKNLIMERILEFGTKDEIHWLFKTYGVEEIKEFISRFGVRRLSKRAFNFYSIILGVKIKRNEWMEIKRKLWRY